MSNQKITVNFNQAFIDSVNSKAYGINEEKLIEIAERTPGVVITEERVKIAEKVITDELQGKGLTGEFFFNPVSHSTAVISIMPVPLQLEGKNQHYVMYNPAFVKYMEPKFIAATVTYAVEVYKLMLNGDLTCQNRRTGEYLYKGEAVTFTTNSNVDTPIEKCAPWRKDLLVIQCDELGISLTNELALLTGIEPVKAHEIYSECNERYNANLAFRKAAIEEGERSNA